MSCESRVWRIDTDVSATYSIELPPHLPAVHARTVLNEYMNVGVHEYPFAGQVEIPDGGTAFVKLTCAAPQRTGRSIVEVTPDNEADHRDPATDHKLIDPRWDGRALAKALYAFEAAPNLASAGELAAAVRAAMLHPADPESHNDPTTPAPVADNPGHPPHTEFTSYTFPPNATTPRARALALANNLDDEVDRWELFANDQIPGLELAPIALRLAEDARVAAEMLRALAGGTRAAA